MDLPVSIHRRMSAALAQVRFLVNASMIFNCAHYHVQEQLHQPQEVADRYTGKIPNNVLELFGGLTWTRFHARYSSGEQEERLVDSESLPAVCSINDNRAPTHHTLAHQMLR